MRGHRARFFRIQNQVPHSQIGVTLDTYSHVLPSMQREAAEKMDGLMRSMSSEGKPASKPTRMAAS
jgi:hypothetical protein